MEKNMSNFKKLATSFLRDESGQSMIEYTLVATLIGLAAVAAMTPLGTAIATAFDKVANQLNGV